MRSVKFILSLVLLNSMMACQVTNKATQDTKYFSIKGQQVFFSKTGNKLNCVGECTIKNQMLIQNNSDQTTIYNKFGEVLVTGNKSNIKATQSFVLVKMSDEQKVIFAYTGKERTLPLAKTVSLTNQYLVIEDKTSIQILNTYGQVIKTDQAEKYLKSYISEGFVGYQVDNLYITFYSQGQHQVMQYDFKKPVSMHVEFNSHFLYFSVDKTHSSLFHASGKQLMRFDGRPSQKVFLTPDAVAFYDVSSSATFWDKNGNHLKSFTQKQGLQVVLENQEIKYKESKDGKFKSIL